MTEIICVDVSKDSIYYVKDDIGEIAIRVNRILPVNLFSVSNHLVLDIENWLELIKDKIDPLKYEKLYKKTGELILDITMIEEKLR